MTADRHDATPRRRLPAAVAWALASALAAASALAGCGAPPDADVAGETRPAGSGAADTDAPETTPDGTGAAGTDTPGPAGPGSDAPGTPPPDGDATPPVPGMDLPTRTTARSGADATHTLPDVPVLRAVRTGVQPGADRLVFEFDGDGLPAWSIEYVDRPQYECGSGEAVRLRGDAWLQIRFIGAAAHTPEGEGTSGPRRRDVGLANLLELARTCDFEGEVTWIAAVARPDGYTPRVLSDPARLVVDIAH